MTEVVLLTKGDDVLSALARRILVSVARDHSLTVTEVAMATELGRMLAADAGAVTAPAIVVDGRLFAYGSVSESELREHLRQVRPGP
ncbi:hypothetical protein [Actinomadura sp. SCN-SB]|uniref:hypothetical protein n=1 Tax=Actinomadura sp. SCN-SB TaxID=3373092 RepID=UPI003751B1D3